VAALIYNGRWSLAAPTSPEGAWFGTVVAPGAAIYFLYHYVLEIAMRGRTPGKRVAGVRLVTRDGAAPMLGQHLTRNVFRLIDSFPVFYGVGLVTTLLTKDQVRVGDLAAGTLLVYDRVALVSFEEMKSAGRIDPATVEIIHELLARWDSLNAAARHRLASRLLGDSAGSLNDRDLRDNLERMARGERP
jgi:hypothetical protein